MTEDPRIAALPDIHGHAKGEHKPFAEERPIPYTARMLFLWFFHACRRGSPRFLMVADHMNYLTFEDPAAVNLVRRALKLAQAGDLYGAAETAGVEIGHAAVVSEGLRKGMRYSIGAEIDNDPRCRPDAQNIVDAMKPDGTVRSVHFIPIAHPQHGENWLWAFDNPEFKDLYDVIGTETVWEIYMATLLDAIDKLPGNIVGHFYVPAKFGHWPDDAVLEGYEDRFLDACAERGMAVEVNSRYLYKYFVDDAANLEKYRAVHLRLLRKAKEKNVAIAVGSDAHSPKDQGGAFEAVLALLDEADINEIAFPIGGRLARVALRATEEILRQHAGALAPPVAVKHDVHHVDSSDDDDEQPAAEPMAAPEPAVAVAKPKSRPKKAADVVAAAVVVEAVASDTPAEPIAAPKPKAKPKKAAAIAEPLEASAPVAHEAIVVVAPVPDPAPAKPEKKPAAAKKTVEATIATPPKVELQKAASKKPAPQAKTVAKPVAVKKPVGKAPAKKAAPAKPAAKAAASKKSAPKKAAAKKAAPKKLAVKKAVAKPVAKKPVAKKVAAKKPVAKKAASKKIAAKKPAKKAAPSKTAAKKPVAKKPAPKKPAPKKSAKRARR